MNLRILATIGLFACSVCAGCGGDDDDDAANSGSGSLAANCKKFCALIAPLNCPDTPDDCANYCQLRATSDPDCKSLVEAQVACGAARPASDYSCDPDTGEPTLKETSCTSETDAVIACTLGG